MKGKKKEKRIGQLLGSKNHNHHPPQNKKNKKGPNYS
jgi:hypothetical protein